MIRWFFLLLALTLPAQADQFGAAPAVVRRQADQRLLLPRLSGSRTRNLALRSAVVWLRAMPH